MGRGAAPRAPLDCRSQEEFFEERSASVSSCSTHMALSLPGPASMGSRTPSGVEVCAAEEFDYCDITSAVVQSLEDAKVYAEVDREQVPFDARLPTSGFVNAEGAVQCLEDERLRLEQQRQEDIRKLRVLQQRERAVAKGPNRQTSAQAGYVGLKVTGAPPHAVVQVRASLLLRRTKACACEGSSTLGRSMPF